MRITFFAALLMAGASVPALAQTDAVKLRVDKLEKEMKAVQRKVFPNGVALQPEVGPVDVAGGTGIATNPVADLTARVDGLEAQLRTLTGQVEMDGNRLKKLEETVKALKTEHDARMKAAEGSAVTTPDAGPTPTVVAKPATPVAAVTPPAPKPVPVATVTKPAAAPSPIAKPAATPVTLAKPASTAKPDSARKAAIAAVEVPNTGDTTEDAYSYGFRLWSAKLYPEAQVKLREFVQKYPTHKRASYAQNLLGRAFFDEGKYNNAAVAFYENYTKNAKGERAAESLSWLGLALTRLKKLPDACKVYSEFDEVYGAKAMADVKARVAKGRADAKCAA